MKKEIRIGLSEEDLHDLLSDATFDWTYDGIDVHLFNSDLANTCDECDDLSAVGGKCLEHYQRSNQ
jgi:hypothetical protein